MIQPFSVPRRPMIAGTGVAIALAFGAAAMPGAARAQGPVAPPPGSSPSGSSPSGSSPSGSSPSGSSPSGSSAAGSPQVAASAAQLAPAAAKPDVLVLHFATGSAEIRPDDAALLDQASRLYRDAHPIQMIVTAGSDTVGSPEQNLRLSQTRADAVLHGLVTRGIPAERFELLAKGVSDLAVPTPPGTPEERNRRVEIRWR